jgi:hypothetical protein
MISKKILYSEQLLQLVLALSLLQVDPINYLEWGIARVHSNDGSPWQLEVSHRPISMYPYMGRKHYVPLIEDLVRFDDQLRNNDVQAYLLNLSNEPVLPTALHNDTLSEQQVEDPPPLLLDTSGTLAANNNSNSFNASFPIPSSSVDDIFLHSSVSSAFESIAEQNLADINDYEDCENSVIKSELCDHWNDFENNSSRVEAHSSWEVLSLINYSSFANAEDNPQNEVKKESKERTDQTKRKSDDVDELSNISNVELTAEVGVCM